MIHNVLRVSWCFTSGSGCFMTFHNVLEVFHDVLLCFMLFSESRNDRHRRIGARASDDRGNSVGPQGSAITPQKSAMTPQGSWMETGVTLFLEDNSNPADKWQPTVELRSLLGLYGPTFHVTPIDLCIIFQCNLYPCIMSRGNKLFEFTTGKTKTDCQSRGKKWRKEQPFINYVVHNFWNWDVTINKCNTVYCTEYIVLADLM